MRRIYASVSVGVAMAAALAAPAFAQPGPAAANAQVQAPTAGDQGQSAPGEIVVTAEKRAENVQKVPVAVSVLSPSTIASSGAVNLQDLAKATPALTITPESQPANTSIILRGVGTFAFSIAVEPAVAVIIDDVPQAFQAQALTADLGDVDHVEVLRGPQSTLFGKSASAGLINIVTKAPSDHFTASGQVAVTSDHEYRLSGTVSAPLSDNLVVRLTGGHDNYAGSGRDITNSTRINGMANSTLKGLARWTPTSNLTLTGGITYNRVKSDCCIAAYIAMDPTAPLLGSSYTGAQVTADETVDRRNRSIRRDSPVYSNSRFMLEFAKIGYEFDSGLSLLSVTSHQLFKLYSGADNDFSDVPFTTALNNGAPAPLYTQVVNQREESWTQELRLTSPDTGPFKYVAGLYYQGFAGGSHFRRGPTYNIGNYDTYAGSRNYAAFGQATYDIAPGTRLIGGIRVNREDIDYRFYKNTTSQFFHGNNGETAVTGKAGVQHDLSRDIMVFATYVRGYKGQAYDLTSALNPSIASGFPIKSEHSNDYEAGIRTQFLDRRVTLNLTGYWTDYDNFQAQGLRPDIALTPVLANVGSVRTRGFELEGAARLSRAFTLDGGVSFTDAKIRKYPAGNCYPGQTAAQGCVGGVQNEKGITLPNAPRWKLDVGATYKVPLSEKVDASLDAHYSYQSKVNYTLTGDPSTIQKAFGIVNLAAGVGPSTGKYKVSVFVNNLFDKQYYTRIDNRASLFGGKTAVAGYLPRDFRRYGGLSLSFSY